MSDVLYLIKKRNISEAYSHHTEEGLKELDAVVANFIQELITIKGTCLFDRDYGTTFLTDLGREVNVYKIRYILANNYHSTKEKYGILAVETLNVHMSRDDGFLDLHLKISFPGVAIETNTATWYNGQFTTKTIIEVTK